MSKKTTRIFMALVIFSAVVLSAAVPAEAAGTPSKIITFTDKKVYTAWWMSAKTTTPTFNKLDDEGQTIILYATVLDDDGNIMKGRTIQVTLNDTTFDHFQKAVWTRHSDMVGNNTYFTSTKNLNDTGTFGDAVSNDGLYTTTIAMPASLLTDVATSPRMDDQIRVKIDVKDTASGLTATTYVLISWGKCHQAATTSHPAHVTSTASDICTNCHGGYEHFFENVSKTIPDAYLDVHFQKLGNSLPDSTETTKGMQEYNWNSSQGDSAAPYGVSASWNDRSGGGAVYCRFCHKDPGASNWFDYGSGDRTNLGDKPSCSQGTSGYSGNCHATTSIEGTSVQAWTQNAAISSTNDTLAGINNQKSHNHTTRGANVSCTLCHNGPHGLSRPNPTTTNVTLICQTCHNRSDGWINNTRYNENISHPVGSDCKNCHLNSNTKLDSHLVPIGVFGGAWCMNCHKINGKAPIYIDEQVVNSSNPNYIHYNINKNSSATNTSRICWACHTNNTVGADNKVDASELPSTTHPNGYNTPRKCLDCHNNTGGVNFGAPQNKRHTWYSQDMVTPAVTYCTDCHNQGDSLMAYNKSATTPRTNNESASHYGKNRTDLKALIGTKAYCATCHQNETTVYGPFANEDNKVRADHASQPTTPACGNSTCHRAGALHTDTLVRPSFTEGNISQTCLNCHSSSEYNYHNNTLTCWDCHMNDTGGNIHPIQFVQYNGNFTGAKLTGATCYDCHKGNNVDATVQRVASKTPPKVYSQSHSNDPMNGTKWGSYWDYTPTAYQFADYRIVGGNGTINPAYPFANIKVPSNDYMELNETQTGRYYDTTFPTLSYDRDFSSTPSGNWISNTATGGVGTVSASYDSTTGNPAGSLKGQLTTSSTTTQHFGYIWWNYSFNYNQGSGGMNYTNASVNYSVTVTSATYAQNVYLNLVKPSGAVVTLASSGAKTANTGWLTLSNNSFASALNENGSVTPYKLQLYAVLSGPKTSQVFTVNYDNVNLRIKEKVYNRYEIIINTTGVPVNGNSKLGMAYQVHKENTSLQIYNKTSKVYELLDTLDKSVFYDYTKNISSTYHIDNSTGDGSTGNVSLRFVDVNTNDTDSVTDRLHIRYLYVYTSRGLQYPCEQCHSPNKHYINPTLGSPSKFSAGNLVNQSISASGTWCQQCHWQGAADYPKMIQEYTVNRTPPENVPPEITGNATYAPTAGANDGTDYVDHTGYDFSDEGCFACHGGSLSQSAGITAFVHDVSEGVSGGANCTNCHNVGQSAPKTGALVNITAMGNSNAIHNSLNSGVSTSLPAENKKCWACHGDGSEPGASNHPAKYKTPYTCVDCHEADGTQNFGYIPNNTILNVTQHFWNGTSIGTAAVTSSCYVCHNKTGMMIGLVDPDGAGTGVNSGSNGGNNSVSHYGKKRSDYPAEGTNAYCAECHSNASTVFPFINSANKTIANHSVNYASTNPDCGDCHGTGKIHNSTLYKPAFALPNSSYCITCHGTGGSATIKDLERHNGSSGLNCTQCHLNSTGSIHPVRYLQQDGSTWATSKTNAVNCTTCHQDSGLGGFGTAPIIPTPMNHSTDTFAGGNTSQQSSCDYCHGTSALHNTSGLGIITNVIGSNTVRMSLDNSQWCANCHYAGAPDYAGTLFSPEPPEILNASGLVPATSSDGTGFANHSGYLGSGYNDTNCKSCHDNSLDGGATSLNLSHNLGIGVAGGPNCTACHNAGQSSPTPGALVNVSAMGDSGSIHSGLNSGASATVSAENKKCWACHGDGTEPSGHPGKYKTPYACVDCHEPDGTQNLGYTPSAVLNVTQHFWNGTSIGTAAVTSSCYVCHNKTGMMVGLTLDPDGVSNNVNSGENGGNNSVSHYGKKRSDYPAEGTNAYCAECHSNASTVFPFINNANKTIANHSVVQTVTAQVRFTTAHFTNPHLPYPTAVIV
ncbi:MAG: hypothetical protein OIN89_08535 [Candidatus Methanoperedens sp.]|nr:hypothetical protein [Candidatus Methanoperedens sp.]